MSNRKLVQLFIVVVMSIVVLGPTVAWANTAVLGSDFSHDWSGRTSIKIYDGTNDGHSVYTNYYMDNNNTYAYRLENFKGPGTEEGRGGIYHINRHRACQNRQLAPDNCTPYVPAGP